MRSLRAVSETIREVEGFDVRFVVPDGAERRRIDDYPYWRAARGNWTVAEWRHKRFEETYPDWSVDVVGPDGRDVHGTTLLETLRARYEAESGEPEITGAVVATLAEDAPADEVVDSGPGLRGSRKKTLRTKTLEQTLWDAADKMRGNLEAAEYKHVVLGLVFLKYVSDAFEQRRSWLEAATADEANTDYYVSNPAKRHDIIEARDEYAAENVFWVPVEARWTYLQDRAKQPEIGTLIDAAMDHIERENPTLKGVLPKTYARAEIDKRLLGELVDLIGAIGFTAVDHGADDVLGRVYEYFLGRFAAAEGRNAGEFYTPRSVVRVLVEMLEPYEGRVFDPCCGSGGMFVQSAEFVAAHGGRRDNLAIYGQEFVATTWRLAKMNLALRGIDANLADEAADAFHKDKFPDLRADFILANPPFNLDDWYSEALHDDVRWKFGRPPASNGNFAWVQHFIHHLAPDGVAGFVLANGSLASKSGAEGQIRQRIVEEDLLDCIVSMPDKLFFNTPIAVSLWFIAKNKSNGMHRDRRGSVLFIDARRLGPMETRTVRSLDRSNTERIAQTYHAWRDSGVAPDYEDVPGFCKAASIEEIRDRDFELAPGPFVGATDEIRDDEPIDEKLGRLRAQLYAEFEEADRLQQIVRQRLDDLLRGVRRPNARKVGLALLTRTLGFAVARERLTSELVEECGTIELAMRVLMDEEQDRRLSTGADPLDESAVDAWHRLIAALEDQARGGLLDPATALDAIARAEREGSDPSGVTVSTMASSKGLEWDVVFIADADASNLFASGSDDESRRVFYVAMTRARRELHVAWYGGEPSMFLREAALIDGG